MTKRIAKTAFDRRSVFNRLAFIFQKFISVHQPIKAHALAEELEVCTKTVRRDINILRDLGFQIVPVRHPFGLTIGLRMMLPNRCPFCGIKHPEEKILK